MAYAPCPACALHHVGAVATPECPVCGGEARIVLNEALAMAEGYQAWPDGDQLWRGVDKIPVGRIRDLGLGILCRAVWLGLARVARATVGEPEEVRVAALRERVQVLRDAQVLDGAAPVGSPACVVRVPGDDVLLAGLSAAHTGPSFERLPLGEPPARSAGGHPSELAKLVDPVDLNTRPGARHLEHVRVWRAADVIDQAVTLVAATRTHPDDLVGAAA